MSGALGLAFVSPIFVRANIPHREHDVLVITSTTQKEVITAFNGIDSAGRRKVFVVTQASALSRLDIAGALSRSPKNSRLIILDTPLMLERLGVRILDYHTAGNHGHAAISHLKAEDFTRELSHSQDLSGLALFQLPVIGHQPPKVRTGHMFRAFPALEAQADTDLEAVAVFKDAVIRYMVGLAGRSELADTAQALVQAGGDPGVVRMVQRHMKARKDIQKAYAAVLGGVPWAAAAEFVDPSKTHHILPEIVWLDEALGNSTALNNVTLKPSVPRQLKAIASGKMLPRPSLASVISVDAAVIHRVMHDVDTKLSDIFGRKVTVDAERWHRFCKLVKADKKAGK